jgi:hypothetical protein
MEITAHIPAHDAFVEIEMGDVLEAMLGDRNKDNVRSVQCAINSIYMFLTRIPDKTIAEISDESREIIRKAMIEQVERFNITINESCSESKP